MNITELIIIAIGLAMDAFAVAISQGLCLKKMDWKKALVIGVYFGGFQAGMPLIGYFLGSKLQEKIMAYDHWIAFVLLAFIGINMIIESRDKTESSCEVIKSKKLFVLAIATSIDALAVGVTFAFFEVDIISAVSIIGIITLVISILGVKIGNVFGSKYKSKAEFFGGLILIGMGLKILLEHLNIINF